MRLPRHSAVNEAIELNTESGGVTAQHKGFNMSYKLIKVSQTQEGQNILQYNWTDLKCLKEWKGAFICKTSLNLLINRNLTIIARWLIFQGLEQQMNKKIVKPGVSLPAGPVQTTCGSKCSTRSWSTFTTRATCSGTPNCSPRWGRSCWTGCWRWGSGRLRILAPLSFFIIHRS